MTIDTKPTPPIQQIPYTYPHTYYAQAPMRKELSPHADKKEVATHQCELQIRVLAPKHDLDKDVDIVLNSGAFAGDINHALRMVLYEALDKVATKQGFQWDKVLCHAGKDRDPADYAAPSPGQDDPQLLHYQNAVVQIRVTVGHPIYTPVFPVLPALPEPLQAHIEKQLAGQRAFKEKS